MIIPRLKKSVNFRLHTNTKTRDTKFVIFPGKSLKGGIAVPGSYSRGTDLPPLLRDSLLADSNAAAGFAALPACRQDEIAHSCGRMNSQSQVDELIRVTDNFIYSDTIYSEYSAFCGRYL